MSEPSDTPFFIVGVHRSGTTLLRYMLSSSPRVYIPPESDFIPRFFGRSPHDPLTPRRLERVLHLIFTRYRFVREWQGPPPDLASFGPGPTPTAFLDALYGRYAAQRGAVRWGDKTPIYTSYLPLLHTLFPQARFIHLIRDGRDVALSMLEKWGRSELHVDIYFAARNWVRRIRQGQATGHDLGPARYLELRYEELTANPEPTLHALCAFLEEDFHPAMLAHQEQARREVAAGSFHAPVREPANASRVARWRMEMDSADVRLFEHIAGPLLVELDYPLSGLSPLDLREQGRLHALQAKYLALQTGRAVLQRTGIMPPI